MCGRIISHLDLARVRRLGKTSGSRRINQIKKGFNIGPYSHQAGIMHTSHYPNAIEENIDAELETISDLCPTRLLHGVKWGLSMFISKKQSACINVRIESIEEKFNRITAKRCVIVAEGYYEWKDLQPFAIRARSSEVLYLAGLFSENSEGEVEFAVITRAAPEFMKSIHHRSPGVVPEKDLDQWLDPQLPIQAALTKVKALTEEDVEVYQVSRLVNSVKNESSDCCLPLEKYKEKLKTTGISRFFQPVDKRKSDDPISGKKLKITK